MIMGTGSNSIVGTALDRTGLGPVIGIYNEIGSSITMQGNKNSITGVAEGGNGLNFLGIVTIAGIFNRSGSIAIGNGNNNSITGIGTAIPVPIPGFTAFLASGIFNREGSIISIGNGNNNSINGTGGFLNGIFNRGVVTIGDGSNNSISGTGISDEAYGIYNQNYGLVDNISAPGIITIGNGNNASITGKAEGNESVGILNDPGCIIKMGNGNNDSITGMSIGNGSAGIVNFGDIIMGNGNGTITGTGDGVGIYNDGIIRTGAGKDTVIANGGFAGSGSLFLEEGNDFLKGFGSGFFSGGGRVDTLELTTGTYTVGISGTTTTFTSGDTLMNTTEFEKLIAGTATLNFSSLRDGQVINVV